MKKLFSLIALLTVVGFSPLFVASAFAESATVTPMPHYNQAVASWKFVDGAKCYNIYYGKVNRKNTPIWNHSVRCVPKNMWTYTIKDLKQNVSYEYSVAALSYAGKEYAWSPIAPLIATPMQ